MSLLRNLLSRFWRVTPDASEIDDHTLCDIGLNRVELLAAGG